MNSPVDSSGPGAPVLPSWRSLDEIRFLPGRDSLADIVQAVCAAVGPLVLSEDRLNRLQAAAEKALQERPGATGSRGTPAEVRVRVLAPAASPASLPQDGSRPEQPLPWGFFVMTRSEPRCYWIDLFLYLEG